MFEKKQLTLKFYPTFYKVYSFYCAYEGTYVFQDSLYTRQANLSTE